MHVSNGALASFTGTLPLLHPFGRLQCHDLFLTARPQYRTGFYGPGKYDGSVVNWVNGPLLQLVASGAGSASSSRRSGSGPARTSPRSPPRPGTKAMLLPTTVVGSYSVPEWLERLKTDTTSAGSAPAPGRDPRGGDQGRGQGPGTRRHRHRLRRRAAPGQRRGLLPGPPARRAHHAAGQDRLFRLLRRRGHPPAARTARRDRREAPAWTWPPTSGSSASSRSSRSSSPSPGRSRCPAGSATVPTTSPATWSARWPAGSTPRPASWPRPAPASCRSTSRSWPGTRSTPSWPSRRSTWSPTA